MRLSTEAKVGSVTITGLILLAYMIMHLSGFSISGGGYPIHAVFGQVSGLKEGNVVRYAGVDVGRVSAISVSTDGVRVTALINPDIKIPQGSQFTIGSDGLLGEKYIGIVPPQQVTGYLSHHEVVRGMDPQGLDQLVANADKVLIDIQQLVRSLNDVLGDEKVKNSLRETAVNAKEITANLNIMSAALARMSQDNESDVRIMVSNLKAMSGSLSDVAERVDRMFAAADNDGQTVRDLTEAIHNIKQTSVRVEKMAAALEGVITDPETSKNIKETLKNAREASAKANKMLSKMQSFKAQAGFEVLHSGDTKKYVSNADVRVQTSEQGFAIIGASDIGQNTKSNFQVGKASGNLAGRVGIIDSKAGVGLDTQFGSQLRLSLDAYDPNDVRVKLRAQYKISSDTSIVGQTENINKSGERQTYMGIRQTF